MRAMFENLGPINKAELELKDLTIIAGANNTGKTNLAYTLYGFLRLMRNSLLLKERVKELPFNSNKAVKEILDSGSFRLPFADFDKMGKNSLRILYGYKIVVEPRYYAGYRSSE